MVRTFDSRYPRPTRRAVLTAGLGAGVAVLLSSCGWDGNFTVLGYTTKPNYDCSIRTVYVPVFKNLSFRRGVEFDLTKAVVREIEAKTPFKVESDPSRADTELLGTIVSLNKIVINRNQLNEVREAETYLSVEIVWRDLRPGTAGEILSAPKPKEQPPAAIATPWTPPEPPPALVMSVASFIPELGESITTAEQKNVNQLAVQIVSAMETPW